MNTWKVGDTSNLFVYALPDNWEVEVLPTGYLAMTFFGDRNRSASLSVLITKDLLEEVIGSISS